MELGALADWVSAAGAVLAVGAAVSAWRISQRLLEIEQKRDERRSAQAHRGQAELAYALGAKLPGRDEDERWGKGTTMIQRVVFRDASRCEWQLENGTKLAPATSDKE